MPQIPPMISVLSLLSLSLHAPSLSSLPRRQQHLASSGSGATTPLGAAAHRRGGAEALVGPGAGAPRRGGAPAQAGPGGPGVGRPRLWPWARGEGGPRRGSARARARAWRRARAAPAAAAHRRRARAAPAAVAHLLPRPCVGPRTCSLSLSFCVIENEDAFLPCESDATQNGCRVCLLRWSVISEPKTLCRRHFAFGSAFTYAVGDSLRPNRVLGQVLVREKNVSRNL